VTELLRSASVLRKHRIKKASGKLRDLHLKRWAGLAHIVSRGQKRNPRAYKRLVTTQTGRVPRTLTRRKRAIPQPRRHRTRVAQMHVQRQEASTRTRLSPEETG